MMHGESKGAGMHSGGPMGPSSLDDSEGPTLVLVLCAGSVSPSSVELLLPAPLDEPTLWASAVDEDEPVVEPVVVAVFSPPAVDPIEVVI